MNVEITKELFEAVGKKKMEPFLSEQEVRWGHGTIELFKLSKKNIEALRKLLDEVELGKRVVADIDVWLSAAGSADGVVVNTLIQFAAILYEVLQDKPKHWLYKYDDQKKVWCAWYVSNIVHRARQTGRDGYYPEHVNVVLTNVTFGRYDSTSIEFRKEHIRGRKVLRALEERGYVPESKELAKEYAAHEAHFLKHHSAVGRQFLARGVGESLGEWWYARQQPMEVYGQPTRCVIDVVNEDGERSREKDREVNHEYWHLKSTLKSGMDPKDIKPGDEAEPAEKQAIPESFAVPIFDMRRHQRMKIHCSSLTEYVYDEKLSESLVVPDRVRSLVGMLVHHRGTFSDIVSGKGGGVSILTAGPPGVGKTLTAEVYAESDKRPLYSVQCSQLGTNEAELEKSLQHVFSRAKRWNAILLLDEADVYVMRRGADLKQNAIVGVFLRVMEYYDGVMFLTTNRGDTVDDAIASRCIARIDYKLPVEEEQVRIWGVLAKAMGVKLATGTAEEAAKLWRLSGRDVKQMLKLASLVVAAKSKKTITMKTLKFVKRFKPTASEGVVP